MRYGNHVRLAGVAAVCAAAALLNGCAMLQQFTGTQTSDGNANLKAQLGEYKGLKHAVACRNFDNQAGWHGNWNIGQNLSIMLESALYDTDRFVVVERKEMADVIAEQDLVASGRAAKASNVARAGKLRPAKYLATGAVTVVEENQSGGDGGISFKGISLGGSRGKAKITIIAKLVDTTTGQVVAKQTISGLAGRVGFNVGLRYRSLGTNFGGFEKTPLAEAAQDCINQAAVFLAKKIEKQPFEAAVVSASGGQVIINRGESCGIDVGQTFVMRELGKELTDPQTGELLGFEEGKELGQLKVVKVTEKVSYCSVTSGTKSPKAGTLVLEK